MSLLQISLSSESIKHLDFYRNIVAPFIESYSTSAKCLESLAGSQNQEQAHVKSVLGEIKTQLSQGKLKFSEYILLPSLIKTASKSVRMKTDKLEINAQIHQRCLTFLEADSLFTHEEF